MGYQDKSLQCADGSAEFTFTAKEQEFYESKGFVNEPKRCMNCRQTRKSERRGSAAGGRGRQMFDAVYAQWGKETQVPFEPRQEKHVYCSECYSKLKVSQ